MIVRPAAAAALAVLTLAGCGRSDRSGNQAAPSPAARQPFSLYLSSSAFTDGQTLPTEYTCDGTGHSPPLQWSDAPAQTQSFAIVLEDPDAPNGTFRHWGAYDIPATTHAFPAGEAQDGASGFKQTRNDFGNAGYGPPCPPKGGQSHHYRFRLMALNVARLGSPSDVKDLLNAAGGHVLGTAEVVALYGGTER